MLLIGLLVLAVAVIALTSMVTIAYVRLSDEATTQYQACEQANVLRREDNRSHYADFQVFSFVAARFLQPTKTETARQKQVTGEFAGALHAAVKAKEWTPVTDCVRVPDRTPRSIPFYQQLPPPDALR